MDILHCRGFRKAHSCLSVGVFSLRAHALTANLFHLNLVCNAPSFWLIATLFSLLLLRSPKKLPSSEIWWILEKVFTEGTRVAYAHYLPPRGTCYGFLAHHILISLSCTLCSVCSKSYRITSKIASVHTYKLAFLIAERCKRPALASLFVDSNISSDLDKQDICITTKAAYWTHICWAKI